MGSHSKLRTRSGSLLAGPLLVLLGVLLLLTATGTASFGIWLRLFDFWPVLLVLIGVELVFAEKPISVRVGLISLVLLGAVLIAFATLPQYEPAEPLRVSYLLPAADVDTLHLSAGFFGGELAVTSETPFDGSLAALMAADFSDRPARIIRDQSESEVAIELLSAGPYLRRSHVDGLASFNASVSFPVGLADWALMLSPDTEVEIDIDSFVADLDLDLRNVNVRRVSIEGAVADLIIHLPINAGETQVEIAAGVADVELVVADSVAALINVDSPFGSTQIDQDRFVNAQDGYRSIGYSEAENRVNVNIESFSANVTVSSDGVGSE